MKSLSWVSVTNLQIVLLKVEVNFFQPKYTIWLFCNTSYYVNIFGKNTCFYSTIIILLQIVSKFETDYHINYFIRNINILFNSMYVPT